MMEKGRKTSTKAASNATQDANARSAHSADPVYRSQQQLQDQPVQPHRPRPEAKTENRVIVKKTVEGTHINNYHIKGQIGKGTESGTKVFKAVDLLTDEKVAIKALPRKHKNDRYGLLSNNSKFEKKFNSGDGGPKTPLSDKKQDAERKINREIAIMKKLDHAHVVKLLEVLDDKTGKTIYIVMEYLSGGDIKWQEHDEPILHMNQIRRIMRDVVLGLEYLHSQGIIHRDIKPSNLLWTRNRHAVKIADFGISQFSQALRLRHKEDHFTSEELENMNYGKNTWGGTPAFMPPELCPIDQSGPVKLSNQSDEGTRSTSTAILEPALTQESPLGPIPAVMVEGPTPSAESPPTNASSFFSPLRPSRSLSKATTTRSISRPSIDTTGPSRTTVAPLSTPYPAADPGNLNPAVDIWALGVTLYCFFFGKVPYSTKTPSEPSLLIYAYIRDDEWIAFETMTSEKIPCPGRHLPPSPPGEVPSEGYLAMSLLEKMLDKDWTKRATLDEIKRHPWISKDLPNPEHWWGRSEPAVIAPAAGETTLPEPSAVNQPPPEDGTVLRATDGEENGAVKRGRIWGILKKVLNPWSGRNQQVETPVAREPIERSYQELKGKNIGTRSAPDINLKLRFGLPSPTTAPPPSTVHSNDTPSSTRTARPKGKRKDKGKGKDKWKGKEKESGSGPSTSQPAGPPTSPTPKKSGEFTAWPMWNGPRREKQKDKRKHSSGGSVVTAPSSPELIHQSSSKLSFRPSLRNPSLSASYASTPQSSSPISADPSVPSSPTEERKGLGWLSRRSRQDLQSRQTSRSSMGVQSSISPRSETVMVRRSDDVLSAQTGRTHSGTMVYAERRTASQGDYQADITSLYSGRFPECASSGGSQEDPDEILTFDTRARHSAANSPGTSSPVYYGDVPDSLLHRQGQPSSFGEVSLLAGPSTSYPRRNHLHHYNTNPDLDTGVDHPDYDEEDSGSMKSINPIEWSGSEEGVESSIVQETTSERYRSGDEERQRGRHDDDGDEDDDSDSEPVEVHIRRPQRRPSESIPSSPQDEVPPSSPAGRIPSSSSSDAMQSKGKVKMPPKMGSFSLGSPR